MKADYARSIIRAMRITVNGQHEHIDGEVSLAELLAQRKIEPVRVAVEINETIVPRKSFPETNVRDGDRIEIVTFVGGG